MRTLWKLALAAALLLPFTAKAAGEPTYWYPWVPMSGLTNNVLSNGVASANLGPAIDVRRYDEVALMISFTTDSLKVVTSTVASNSYWEFQLSVDGTNFQTYPVNSLLVPYTSTNGPWNHFFTNINVGAAGWLQMSKIINTNNNLWLTNIGIRYSPKPRRHGTEP